MRFKEALERAEAEDNDEHSSGLTILSFRDLRQGIAEAVATERERCERVLLALLHASYSMSGPQALQRALSEIRKSE